MSASGTYTIAAKWISVVVESYEIINNKERFGGLGDRHNCRSTQIQRINLALIYRYFLYFCSMKKIDFRTVSEFERLALRKRAIRLIVSGTRKGVVADLIGVRPNTVSEWWKEYQLAGSKGLVSKKKGWCLKLTDAEL